jgi:dTDP-4-amino-4,6-dideoxygalactose transaminase
MQLNYNPCDIHMIPFNKPYICGKELWNLVEAHRRGQLAGDGDFTKLSQNWLMQRTQCAKAFLTHSCTSALEMMALLFDIAPGDEIIMPSYTFVSTANAFVMRGGVPVFVDIREDTLNLDERLIEDAITPKTRMIVPVHYAGVACEMDEIETIARKHGLGVVEDAAQGVMSTYKGRALGSIGALGAYSFHETKNIISGEGGALLVNDPSLVRRAEIIREKGTDRSRFFRGEVDKYTWQDIGSSFLPGELIAAFLWAQLNEAEDILSRRLAIWQSYHDRLKGLEEKGLLRRPIIPPHCAHNAHLYYIILSEVFDRQEVITKLKERGVHAVFHYVPLHSSPAAQRYTRTHGALDVTQRQSERLIRLPFWIGLEDKDIDYVCDVLGSILVECA